MKKKILISILSMIAIVSSAPRAVLAQEPQTSPAIPYSPIESVLDPTKQIILDNAQSGFFGLYQNNVTIPISWARMPNVSKYQYKIINISTNKVVKNVRTAKNKGFFPKKETVKDGSYKMIVYGLDKNNKPIQHFTWTSFFHVGKVVKIPSGKANATPVIQFDMNKKIMIGSTNGKVMMDDYEETTGE